MNAREAGAAAIHRLSAEVAHDQATLALRDAELDALLDAKALPESARAAATALVLDRSYTALEALLERAVRALDGNLEHGSDWHRNLLAAARLAIPEVRPALIDQCTRAADDLRRFRHFLRHACAAPLDGARVAELAAGWRDARPARDSDLAALDAFLEDLAHRLENA